MTDTDIILNSCDKLYAITYILQHLEKCNEKEALKFLADNIKKEVDEVCESVYNIQSRS